MMKAEYRSNAGCLQKDSAERERYAGARSVYTRETRGKRRRTRNGSGPKQRESEPSIQESKGE